MDLLDPEISGETVMRLVPAMLADGEGRLMAATNVLQRLQSQLDSKAVSRSILKLLCAHCSGEAFLVDLLLEFMLTYEEPVHIIELMSMAAADSPDEKIASILDAYKSLIVDNRKLLVPVIGSISELNLSKRQKASFLNLVKGALSVVDESDIPTVVNALLYIADQNNARGIMNSIRKEAVRIPLSITLLLVDPLATAVRSRAECAKAYWSDLKSGVECSSLDFLVIAMLLESHSMKRTASREVILLAERNYNCIELICCTISLPQAAQTFFNLFRLVLQISISLSLPGVPPPSRSGHDTLISWLQPLAMSIFRHSTALRQPLLSALLAACSGCTKGSERGASAAAAAVASLAAGHGEDMRSVAHLVFQFLAQHASSCTESTLGYLGSASVILARGERGVELLVLIQKQLGQPRPGTQRPGLILAANLLSASSATSGQLAGGADVVLRAVLRLPLAPQWRYSPLVCAALQAAGAGLARAQVADVLDKHVHPAALEAGLIRLAQGGEGPGGGARCELTLEAYVARCLSPDGAGVRADVQRRASEREGGAGGAGGWDTGVTQRMLAGAALVKAVLMLEWWVWGDEGSGTAAGREDEGWRAGGEERAGEGEGGRGMAGNGVAQPGGRGRAGYEAAEEGDEWVAEDGEGDSESDSSDESAGRGRGRGRERAGVERRHRRRGGCDGAVCREGGGGGGERGAEGSAGWAWTCWLHVAAACAEAVAGGCTGRGGARVGEVGLRETEAAARWRLRLADAVGVRIAGGGDGGDVCGLGGVCGIAVKEDTGGGGRDEEGGGAGRGGDVWEGVVGLCRQADCGVEVGVEGVVHCLARMEASAETLPVMAEVGPVTS